MARMRTDRDFTVEVTGCMCRVVFLGSCDHRTTRLDPCRKHRSGTTFGRDTVVAEARRIYRDHVRALETGGKPSAN